MGTPWPFAAGARVMVIAPHPDDESLATGGLLQRARLDDAEVRILMLTSGDNNPWVQRLVEHRISIGPTERRRWGQRRQAEAYAALDCLGLPREALRFLNYPDQGLTPMLMSGDDRLVDRLADEIEAWRPTLLVSPSLADLHPDHSAAAVFVRMALRRLEASLSPPELLEFLVHTRGRPTPRTVYLPLTPTQTRIKRDAILCHAAQFVFCRRQFLRFAADREPLFVPDSGNSADGRAIHIARDCTAIRLDLHTSSTLGAFGSLTLCVATSLAGHTVSRLSIPIPARSSPTSLPIFDHLAPCGDTPNRSEDRRSQAVRKRAIALTVNALVQRRPFAIRIPLSAFPAYDQLWAKCERRFGFFDEDGWIALEG